MHAAREARSRGATIRIARDVGAIGALAAELLALHVAERRGPRAPATVPDAAREVRWRATWSAAAVGALASLPSGAALGVATAAVEAGLLSEIESRAMARLLAIAEPHRPGAAAPAAGEAPRALLRAGVAEATRLIAKRGARAALRKVGLALPPLGMRTLLGPAAPVVAAAWSAASKGLEMHRRLTPAVRAVDRSSTETATCAAAPVAAPARREILDARQRRGRVHRLAAVRGEAAPV